MLSSLLVGDSTVPVTARRPANRPLVRIAEVDEHSEKESTNCNRLPNPLRPDQADSTSPEREFSPAEHRQHIAKLAQPRNPKSPVRNNTKQKVVAFNHTTNISQTIENPKRQINRPKSALKVTDRTSKPPSKLPPARELNLHLKPILTKTKMNQNKENQLAAAVHEVEKENDPNKASIGANDLNSAFIGKIVEEVTKRIVKPSRAVLGNEEPDYYTHRGADRSNDNMRRGSTKYEDYGNDVRGDDHRGSSRRHGGHENYRDNEWELENALQVVKANINRLTVREYLQRALDDYAAMNAPNFARRPRVVDLDSSGHNSSPRYYQQSTPQQQPSNHLMMNRGRRPDYERDDMNRTNQHVRDYADLNSPGGHVLQQDIMCVRSYSMVPPDQYNQGQRSPARTSFARQFRSDPNSTYQPGNSVMMSPMRTEAPRRRIIDMNEEEHLNDIQRRYQGCQIQEVENDSFEDDMDDFDDNVAPVVGTPSVPDMQRRIEQLRKQREENDRTFGRD